MGLECARFALSTGAVDATQDMTISGIGTPKGVWIEISRATNDNQNTAGCMMGAGAYDGTNQRCVAFSCQDAVTTSNSASKIVNDAAIITLDPTTGNIDGVATVAFITDGIRLTIRDQFPAAFYVIVTFFVGSAYDVDLVAFDSESDSSFTTGSRPDLILAAGTSKGYASVSGYSTTTGSAHANFGLGFLVRNTGGSELQHAVGYHYQDGVASGGSADEAYSYISNGSLLLIPDHDLQYSGISVATTSTGGTIVDGGGYPTLGFMLCVNFGGTGSIYSGAFAIPTSVTNPWETTGQPHQPTYVMEAMSLNTAEFDEHKDFGLSYHVGHAFNTSPNDLAIGGRVLNSSSGSTNTIAKNHIVQNKIMSFRAPDTDPTNPVPPPDADRATFSSFASGKYSRNFSVSSGVARRVIYFTFAPITDGGSSYRRLGSVMPRIRGAESVRIF